MRTTIFRSIRPRLQLFHFCSWWQCCVVKVNQKPLVAFVVVLQHIWPSQVVSMLIPILKEWVRTRRLLRGSPWAWKDKWHQSIAHTARNKATTSCVHLHPDQVSTNRSKSTTSSFLKTQIETPWKYRYKPICCIKWWLQLLRSTKYPNNMQDHRYAKLAS